MRENKIIQFEYKIKDLKRIRLLAKEKFVFKRHKISELDKNIFIGFGKVPTLRLAKKLKCNRSYIYAVLGRYKQVFTRKEIYDNKLAGVK